MKCIKKKYNNKITTNDQSKNVSSDDDNDATWTNLKWGSEIQNKAKEDKLG